MYLGYICSSQNVVSLLTIEGKRMRPELLKAIENKVGRTADEIAVTPLDELRRDAEAKLNHSLTFESRWLIIGRGSVLHGDRVLSHEAVERMLDNALRP